ncbi:glycosyltransferase family protein [Pontibacterium granulatum]|uniref:MJ1255/VC2487 family glycosyltransferase n=1 Tax=Pontibacterium granulatum TaxID=2036029 RepID=UPI00249B5EE9|nr:MJ1255/VC2487 family glycosyltransferase [Pontibacterium granulatum]MDI3325694.1 glycosyltransferase family protein [Pontibacterium granulatum]
MRVLYGVQATGNGHITRARVMAPALKAAGVEVDYLFSGRPADQLFNMEPFGDYLTREGLTFVQRDGQVKVWDTLRKNNVLRCWRDANALDLSSYDLVITDFEPVTAWAAKRKGVPSVGIAHQYALCYPIPGHNHHVLSRLIQLFAPAKTAIGVHWHHYDYPVLPPLIQPPLFEPSVEQDKVLVYLPVNPIEELETRFAGITDYRFYIYCAIDEPYQRDNLYFMPFSREGFQRDLSSCSGVVTNCGFGLISEALQLGKKVFSMPVKGQVEQQSNAHVLDELGLATIARDYDEALLSDWLELPQPEPRMNPDVAGQLAQWIASGCGESADVLAKRLWQNEPGIVVGV